jgi:hypothetical protein
MPVPFSVYSQLTENWAVMGNLGWQNWTKFGYTPVSVSNNVGATAGSGLPVFGGADLRGERSDHHGLGLYLH